MKYMKKEERNKFMKLLNWLENLKLYKKIIIILFSLLMVAFLNYFYYNYQTLKLPENEKFYEVSYNQEKEEEDTMTVSFDLENKYAKYIIIEYQTTSENDFTVSLTGNSSNTYGDLEDTKYTDYCYSFLHKCGFYLHKKIGAEELTFSQKNVEILSITVDNTSSFNWVSFTFWGVWVTLILVLFLFKSVWFKKLHLLAFLLCISIGTVFLVCCHNITSTTFDDETHFNRVNTFITHSKSDSELESRLVIFNYLRTPQEKKEYQEYLNQKSTEVIEDNTNTNLFRLCNINYLPMAITVKVANTIGLSYTTSFFLGRVVNLLIYSIVIMFTVKIMPCYKLLTLLIGILPQSIFLASNYSYDPTVTAFSLLAFSVFAKEYHYKDKKIEMKSVIIFVLVCLYASFPKMIYSLFILLMLFLPKEKFETKKKCYIFRTFICFIFLLCVSSFLLPTVTSSDIAGDPRGGATSVSGQLELMIKNPLAFVKVFIKSGILTIAENLVGPSTFGLLCHYGGMLIDTGYYLVLIALVLAFISEKDFPEIKFKNRIIMLMIYFCIICFIYLSMYLSFTPVGANVIKGVQPRYFIPLLLPIIYCFSSKNVKNTISYENSMIVSTTFFIVATFILIYFTIIIPYCL